MHLIQTPRLRIRRFHPGDAPFILKLVNDPDFLRYIGDRKVRNLEDAQAYLERGPIAMYRDHGFGLYMVETHSGEPIGTCGLMQRQRLAHADIGFAFLPEFRHRGLAEESARAVLNYALEELGQPNLFAIVQADNLRSIRLLRKIGFKAEGWFRLPDSDEPLSLMALHSEASQDLDR
ncbi:GNAT family N-acetyltransferase [Microbulbifer discodermiae]|uniref:GNAT family N-acetyltransferase n=1 Tax=Microbulbifer sp. 2201CG32-9 TaxID=3232309 RepID=UPI00345B6196